MTKDELRRFDQTTIRFNLPTEPAGIGTLNYVSRNDSFQIIYLKQNHPYSSNVVIELDNEMIEAVTLEGDTLHLEIKA